MLLPEKQPVLWKTPVSTGKGHSLLDLKHPVLGRLTPNLWGLWKKGCAQQDTWVWACFHLPGFRFGYILLTHSHMGAMSCKDWNPHAGLVEITELCPPFRVWDPLKFSFLTFRRWRRSIDIHCPIFWCPIKHTQAATRVVTRDPMTPFGSDFVPKLTLPKTSNIAPGAPSKHMVIVGHTPKG